MTSRRGGMAWGAAVLALGVVLWLGGGARERRQTRMWLEGLREEIHALRVAADSCQGAVAREEAGFKAFDRQVDSLREEVRELEALDRRGVPRERYDAYMEAFERYNGSVPTWEAQADSLQTHWEACRELVRRHNTLADSLRETVGELRREGRLPPAVVAPAASPR